MAKILNSTSRIPKNLQTDDGKEFYNANFKRLLQTKNINHYSTFSSLKASIIERFNRTLKGMMWKEFSFRGTHKWIDIYKDLINDYNNTIHSTIRMTPNDVNSSNEQHLLDTVYSNLKVFRRPKFKINDEVRISKYKHVFEKGYTPNWTTEVFKIKSIKNTNPTTYILEDYQGNTIEGGFYEYELIKTKLPQVYLVEKVLRRRNNRVYVKWLGFSSEHNSWVNVNDIN
ncbi:unnamed protein product [Ceratitis capitata]|uniref:(Mediterranean fruit fly) hypothetical protein n=1 Tax=Ceratitis capitata TaxID=7213 RepID=A0A811URC1_CERCA|nr:unnamed protein product [Ceratitis capitata]